MPGLLCADPERWEAAEGRARRARTRRNGRSSRCAPDEAAARIFWPLGNTRLEKRLPLIEAPTLLIWGARGPHHAAQLRRALRGGITGKTEIRVIPGAGHLAELDKPDEVAQAILEWTR